MSTSDRVARIGIAVVLACAAAAVLLGGCAGRRPTMDTPQYRACRLVCAGEGYPLASLLEDADTLDCECRKPAAPPGGAT